MAVRVMKNPNGGGTDDSHYDFMTRVLLRDSRYSQQQQHTKGNHNGNIGVAHGCLLVPAVLIVWYYWFRKSARQVISRVVDTDSAACSPDYEETIGRASTEDEYSTW